MKEYDVFFSYASADEADALLFHSLLTDRGLSVFVASESIETGEDWTEQIMDALWGCTVIMFIATEESVRSPFVQQELGAAMILNKRIIPVLSDTSNFQLPGWMKKYQSLNIKNSIRNLEVGQISKLTNIIISEREKIFERENTQIQEVREKVSKVMLPITFPVLGSVISSYKLIKCIEELPNIIKNLKSRPKRI